MPAYKFVVLTNAMPGQESEFNEWYDDCHLSEILAIPGVDSCRRLSLVDGHGKFNDNAPYQYLTIYEVETDDIQMVSARLADPSSRTPSVTVDVSRTAVWMFEDYVAKKSETLTPARAEQDGR